MRVPIARSIESPRAFTGSCDRIDMRAFVREHVGATAAALAAVSLALVFAAVLGYVPRALLPRYPPLVAAIPHLNAALSVLAIGTIAAGWRWIRRSAVRKHRVAMGTATALFVAFLGLYLYRIVLVGPTTFPGEGTVATLYYAILAIHIVLAIVCVPLVYYVLLLALTRPVAAIRDSRHARVGRVAASLWLVSFVLGVVVYLMLYG
jgi:putative membrane protein